jgi:hypothetical protein
VLNDVSVPKTILRKPHDLKLSICPWKVKDLTHLPALPAHATEDKVAFSDDLLH